MAGYSAADRLLLSTDIYDYHYVSNGKTTVDSIDDHEEMNMTDVSLEVRLLPRRRQIIVTLL